jgi:hypothetical protein
MFDWILGGCLKFFVTVASLSVQFHPHISCCVPDSHNIITHVYVIRIKQGATFMAAGGSAPEFFTSLMGVFVAKVTQPSFCFSYPDSNANMIIYICIYIYYAHVNRAM